MDETTSGEQGMTSTAFSVADCFSRTYAEARGKFRSAAHLIGANVVADIHPELRGIEGEELAIDVVYIGPDNPSRLTIVTSGTHGAEGYCGSACQTALLRDRQLLDRFEQGSGGLLLVHAVNPYGFSWMHRTNEDNIDLNRNGVQFPLVDRDDADYQRLERLLVGESWPRTHDEANKLAAYCEKNGGLAMLWKKLSGGQYSYPDGLFYGGTASSWSINVVREVLCRYAGGSMDVAWIDIHTGLGPYGHAEKIFPGRQEDVGFARMLWGSDVVDTSSGRSVSGGVSGSVIKLIYEVCPSARAAILGLEFGTVPYDQVIDSLVADAWLRRQRAPTPSQSAGVAALVRSAFYCESDDWKGSVLGQARMVFLQCAVGMTT
ncbi:DUF2817 domain-containing protein [Paraburkholderia sp. MPAMCS5]|uniref:DUF2817 domain-containing protein n=1 Tax=Paraburkholderia sp. MPAMCS5 TaxID=3112563 RepID=UPI002E186C01|nr:DUF2817 domain-containing protein [Paraburkholderia sp. MPAMCS5]